VQLRSAAGARLLSGEGDASRGVGPDPESERVGEPARVEPNTSVAVDRARDLPALISAEATGRIRRFSGYREWTTPEFIVDSGQPLVDVGVDGEALQLPPPLRFRSLPGALRVRTPLDAPGASPAALRPAGPWRTATALVRVVGGRPGQ
jgi:hypothetical protein